MLNVQEMRETLLRAAHVLSPVLPGFDFRVIACGCGPAGAFAHGEFANGPRRVAVLVRHQALLVIYRVGQASVSHLEYLGSLRQGTLAGGQNWFAGCAISAANKVRNEIAQHGADFVHGSGAEFLKIAARVAEANAGPIVLSCFQKLG